MINNQVKRKIKKKNLKSKNNNYSTVFFDIFVIFKQKKI